MQKTEPKKRFSERYKVDPKDLAAQRYGTESMNNIWGEENTFNYGLGAQGQSAMTLHRLHPHLISEASAFEISNKASINAVKPDRIRYFEALFSHDIIGLNKALEETLEESAKPHVNQLKTSSDTTQPARAMQLKKSLEVIANTAENLRDIIIEKSVEWIDIPHIDQTHKYDALPTVAGRPLSHFAEMLHSGLDYIKFVYENSIIGKWGDATGNHHSATAVGIDGLKLQQEYCEDLGVGFMIAPAQVPGLEFEADVVYAMARVSETANNLARYIASGRGDDREIFVNANPKRNKGSSGMPHKDSKNGNPTVEEQTMSLRNYVMGMMTTALANCQMEYARDLSASANSRINFEYGFKFMDHSLIRLANTMYWIGINEENSVDRVTRSLGYVASSQVMAYLTDKNLVKDPMARSHAHDLLGDLSTTAYQKRISFFDILSENNEVTSRIEKETLAKITDPIKYIGQSKEIVNLVKDKCYKKKTLV